MKQRMFAAVTAVLGCACASTIRVPGYRHPDFAAPQEVAVLPVINRTQDAGAAPVVRELLCDALVARGYRVIPPDWVDARLADAGYADTARAMLAPREDVVAALAASTLVVATIHACDRVPVAAFIEKRTVRLTVEILGATTTWWQNTATMSRYRVRTPEVPRSASSRTRRVPPPRVVRRSGVGGATSGRHPMRDDLGNVVATLAAEVPGESRGTGAW